MDRPTRYYDRTTLLVRDHHKSKAYQQSYHLTQGYSLLLARMDGGNLQKDWLEGLKPSCLSKLAFLVCRDWARKFVCKGLEEAGDWNHWEKSELIEQFV